MKRNNYIILLCILLLVFLTNISFTNNNRFTKIEGKNEVIVHEEEIIPPYEKIYAMIVDDGKIFLYYDAFGLVNVYSSDGTFQYGIQFGTIENGHGDIAYFDKKLYILTRTNVIYIFEDAECLNEVSVASEREKFLRYEERFLQQKNNMYDGEIYYLLKEVNMITKQTLSGQFVTVINLEDRGRSCVFGTSLPTSPLRGR